MRKYCTVLVLQNQHYNLANLLPTLFCRKNFKAVCQVKLTDRHGVGNHMPMVDPSQDVVLEWGKQNDTHTVIQFSR